MIAHPLLDALIQPSRPLPAQFRSGVGMPQKLPRLLRYGPIAPPQVGGSHFTGGQVAQPQTSMVHPQAAEGFTPPHFNPSNPTAPSLAPFVSTPQGGQPTGPPFNVAGEQTGATSSPPENKQTNGGGGPFVGPDSTSPFIAAINPNRLGGGGGGTGTNGGGASLFSAITPTSSGSGGGNTLSPLLTAILTALGQKLNPSVLTRYAE